MAQKLTRSCALSAVLDHKAESEKHLSSDLRVSVLAGSPSGSPLSSVTGDYFGGRDSSLTGASHGSGVGALREA